MTRCKSRLLSPETAGFCDIVNPETGEVFKTGLESLREAALRSPHLRPCPKHKGSRGTWNWIERTWCEKCPAALKDE